MKKRKVTTLTFHVNGQKIRRGVSYYTAADLAEKRQKILAELEEKNHPLFSDVALAWQEEHEAMIQHYTAESYKAPVKDVIAEFRTERIDEITPIMIQALLEKMQRQGYARQTINLRKVVLSQIFDYAVLHGYIQFNPAKVCKVPKTQKTIGQPPSEEDLARIAAAPDSFWKRYYLQRRG